MKKLLVYLVVGMMALSVLAPVAKAAGGKGGLYPMCAGCLFGARAAAAVNDGKEIHFLTEWMYLIFSPVPAVINAMNGYEGLTTKDLAAKYGSTYF